MESRKLELSFDQAKEWSKSSVKELQDLAKSTFPELFEKQLPKSWEELSIKQGYFINGIDSVVFKEPCSLRQLFATKEQAEASIALAQLSQLMKVYNGDWVADFENGRQDIFCIGTSKFLAFKNLRLHDLFLENFSELILKAKPLL